MLVTNIINDVEVVTNETVCPTNYPWVGETSSDTEVAAFSSRGNVGIGVISDTEDQPLIIGSHLGNYAIVTVGRIANTAELVKKIYGLRSAHFSEMSGAEINPTEIIATLKEQYHVTSIVVTHDRDLALGIADRDLQTTVLSLQPVYDYSSSPKPPRNRRPRCRTTL